MARIQGLPFLHAVFPRTLVTETELDECLARADRPGAAEITAATSAGSLVVIPDIASGSDWYLDLGEASAIAAALARGTGVLMDDRAGRRIALKKESLADFLLRSPLRGSGIVIDREQDFERDIEL